MLILIAILAFCIYFAVAPRWMKWTVTPMLLLGLFMWWMIETAQRTSDEGCRLGYPTDPKVGWCVDGKFVPNLNSDKK